MHMLLLSQAEKTISRVAWSSTPRYIRLEMRVKATEMVDERARL